MPKPQPTARQRIERAFHVSFKLPAQAAELLDAYRDEVLAEFAQDDAREILARHRDQVLTEAAELLQAHPEYRGVMGVAAHLLLAARTTSAQEQPR